MQGIAQFFIDEFRPGDKIPNGRYEVEHWAAMVARGAVMPPVVISPDIVEDDANIVKEDLSEEIVKENTPVKRTRRKTK